MTAFGQYEDDDTASTLKQRDHKDATDLVAQADTPKMLFVRGGVERDSAGKKAGKGALIADDEAATLDAGNHWTLFQPQAFRKSRRPQSATDDETWVDDGQANTLNVFNVGDTRTTHAIVEPTAFTQNQREEVRSLGDQTAALAANTGMHQTNYIMEAEDWAADETGTLQSRTYKGLNHENARDGQAVVQTYGVRRLTPVECERLQAFPDGWTEPAGSDSARYKALGNAVTVNTVGWILRRMKALM